MQKHREQLANGPVSVWQEVINQDETEMMIHHANGLTIGLNDRERAALFEWLKKGLVKTWLLKLNGTDKEFMFDAIEKEMAIQEACRRWSITEGDVTTILFSRREYL